MRLMRRQQNPITPWTPIRDVWNPMREFEEMNTRMNRLFGTWPGETEKETLATTDWIPSVNISETNKEYLIQIELPEVEKKDVHVKLENGLLTIEGQREQQHETKDAKYHRVECAYGHFLRQFVVPDDAVSNGIKANFKDGMLKVTVPRSAERKTSSKEIAIS
jgi:HSP20 family protein